MQTETAAARDQILDAAEQLFSRQGFAGTTIKQIGAEAGVNPALLYYYFADKQSLYRDMLERMVGRFVVEAAALLKPGQDPEASIRALVSLQVEYMGARPHIPRLIARELADHGAAHAVGAVTQVSVGVFQRLVGIIQAGQANGRFRAELDPRFAAISTIAQVIYLLIARPIAGILLGHGPEGPPMDVLRAFGGHAADFALAALRVPVAHSVPASTIRSST